MGEQLFRGMYRRPKFLEVLLSIRKDMAASADHDVKNLIRSTLNMAGDGSAVPPAVDRCGPSTADAVQETEHVETPSRV